MSVFKDKTYEGMDWLSQAVEPIHNPLNDFLAKMPDEYVVPREVIFRSLASSWNKSITKDVVINHIYNTVIGKESSKLSYDDRGVLEQCFAFEISDEPVVVEGSSMTGEIKLVKKVNILEDDVAKKMMARASYLSINHRDCVPGAILELGTLLFDGIDKMKEFNECTSKGKLSLIMTYFANSAAEDTFRIRSVKAYENFARLMSNFLSTGNEKDLGKIFKVITMARQDKLIYDVEV